MRGHASTRKGRPSHEGSATRGTRCSLLRISSRRREIAARNLCFARNLTATATMMAFHQVNPFFAFTYNGRFFRKRRLLKFQILRRKISAFLTSKFYNIQSNMSPRISQSIPKTLIPFKSLGHEDMSDTLQPRNESTRFQVEQRQRREHPKYGTKGYLFWVIDVAKYYTSRHCVCTRVLDISIAWIEPVPGHIVGERVYRYGPGANTIVWVVPPRTDVPLSPGWLPQEVSQEKRKTIQDSNQIFKNLLSILMINTFIINMLFRKLSPYVIKKKALNQNINEYNAGKLMHRSNCELYSIV